MGWFGDMLGGAKPKKPPAFYGEAARDSEAQYRKMLMFLGELEPHVADAFRDTPQEWGDIRNQLSGLRQEYIREHPWDKQFADMGRALEYQTLQEVGDAGSEWRQDEAAASALEDFNTRYDQQIGDGDIRAQNYGRSAPGIFGSSAAQRAAAGAAVANEARELTRFRGEDVRRQFLPFAGAYGDSLIFPSWRRLKIWTEGTLQLVAGSAESVVGRFRALYGDYLSGYVNPQMEVATRAHNLDHTSRQRYADLKAGRSGRMLSNAIAIGTAAATGNPMALSSVRLGGGADGSGASAPFAWAGGGGGSLFGGGGGGGGGSGGGGLSGMFNRWNSGGAGGGTYSRGYQTSGLGTSAARASQGRTQYNSRQATSRIPSFFGYGGR